MSLDWLCYALNLCYTSAHIYFLMYIKSNKITYTYVHISFFVSFLTTTFYDFFYYCSTKKYIRVFKPVFQY